MNNILELSGVGKSFTQFELRDISFALQAGFIMGFIGPNGAGKTTTIKLILNMLRPDSGTIKVFGRDNASTEHEFKEKIGVVMDQPSYVDEWRLMDVERATAHFYRKWDSIKYSKLLGDFNLDPKKKIKELSRGMKMKLQIAAALSHEAELLLLDEPTSGLDAVARNELMEILGEFIEDERRGVLFSTHITSDLEKIADYITCISGGGILYTGTKDELLERYRVVKGGVGALDSVQRRLIVGYREHSVGFDGLIEAAKLEALPRTVIAEPVSLDEIILRFNMEGERT